MLLTEDGGLNIPDEETLSSWSESFEIQATTMAPASDGRAAEIFSVRETGYIIDLETMEVVWRENALFGNPTIATIGIDRMVELLQ